MVQWLKLRASTAGGTGSIPDQGTKIPHTMWCGQKEKEKKKYIGKEKTVGDTSPELVGSLGWRYKVGGHRANGWYLEPQE